MSTVKLLRVFEYGASGTSGEKSYWTLKVDEQQTAAEVADIVAGKCALLAGSFSLFEVSVDGKNERRLQDNERPLDVLREWQANGDTRKIFAVKKSTIVRFVDADALTSGAETYVTMDLVDKQGQSKSVAHALEFIAKKRLIAEPMRLLQVEQSYMGRTVRALAPTDSLMVVRRAWDASAATSFAFTRKPDFSDEWRRGSQQRAIEAATQPLLQAKDADERKRLQAVVERECIDWIERVLGQRFADTATLWTILRERGGSNLVALVNAIVPNVIPASRFVAGSSDLALLKNLDLVCDALLRFGLDRRDLFLPSDVVDAHSNVLFTLFVLALEAHRRGHAESWSSTATAGFFERGASSSSSSAAAASSADEARKAARLQARAEAAKALRTDIDLKAVYDAAIESNVPAVHAAIKLDDIDALRQLLLMDLERSELFANRCNERGQAPLHWAANLKRARAIEALVLAGANVDATDANGATPLHLAAARQCGTCVRLLCEAGANAAALSTAGITPVFAACDNNNDDTAAFDAMAAAYAANGAPLDVDTPCGGDKQTCLHVAAREGRERIMIKLLAANASLRMRAAGGDTPLLLAAKVGSVSSCELLLAEGRRREAKQVDLVFCMLSDQDDDGNTALHAACSGNFVAVVQLLKRYDAPLDATNAAGLTPVQVASDEGHLNLVAILDGASLPMPSSTMSVPGGVAVAKAVAAVAAASAPASAPPVPALASGALLAAAAASGPPPPPESPRSGEGERKLFEAARTGDAEAIKQLLSDGAVSVDAKDGNRNSALHLACRHGHVACIKQLLRHKVKLTAHNRAKESALHLAVQFNHADAARALLKVLKPEKRAVLLDAKCERFRRTPLHYAMQFTTTSDTSALDALLECEGIATLEPRDAANNTPLHVAADAGCADAIAKFFVRAAVPAPPGATSLCDINAVNDAGDTALHMAARAGHLTVVRRLAGAGAQKNVRNGLGQTPLHAAVAMDRDEVVAALVVLRVDLTIADNAGETAFALGERLGHRYCASLVK
jgi:ankyrin repeat protein